MGIVLSLTESRQPKSELDYLLEKQGPIAICFADEAGNLVAFQVELDAMLNGIIPPLKTIKRKNA